MEVDAPTLVSHQEQKKHVGTLILQVVNARKAMSEREKSAFLSVDVDACYMINIHRLVRITSTIRLV